MIFPFLVVALALVHEATSSEPVKVTECKITTHEVVTWDDRVGDWTVTESYSDTTYTCSFKRKQSGTK